MSEIKTGEPAFPTGTYEYDGQNNVLQYQENGMTLRDYFAAKAMQGSLSADKNGEWRSDSLSKWAYVVADAMLAERERGE